MGICKDKYVTFLNQFGYNVIRHPRVGITPLTLIGRQSGTVALLGDLAQLIEKSSQPRPKVMTDLDAAPLKGQQSSALDAAIGLNLLGSFIGALDGNPALKGQYKSAKKITFQFDDVLCDRALPASIGEFLTNSVVNADSPLFEQYVMGNGDLFVITEVVKARSFTVSAEKNTGGELAVDVPVVKELLGGKISVNPSNASASAIQYGGEKFLAFGFTAFRLGVEEGKLTMFAEKARGGLALSPQGFGAPGGELLGTGLIAIPDDQPGN